MIDTAVTGDVTGLRGLATWMQSTLKKDLERGADDAQSARSVSDRDWEGRDQEAYTDYARTIVTATDRHASRVGRAADTVGEYADRLRRFKHRMEQIHEDAVNGELTVTGKIIQRPPDATAVAALPAGASRSESVAHQSLLDDHEAAVNKIELYDQLDGEAFSAWQTFSDWIASDLASAAGDAANSDEVDTLVAFVKGNFANFAAGSSLTFFDNDLLRRSAEFSARAEELASARRSGSPARRARGNAPEARPQVREWRTTARSLSRWSRVLGPVGVAVDIGFGIWDVAEGGSPGRATLTTTASIAGGAAAVVGIGAGAAALGVTAPIWGTALAAGALAVGAGWAAGELWDALPDGFTDGVDDAISDTWDGATDAVGDGWDKVTGWF